MSTSLPNLAACFLISFGPTSTLVFTPGTTLPTPPAYNGTIILEGCADTWGNDCSFEDTDEDGYDDVSYEAGAESGDANLDGQLNVLDIVLYANIILTP